MLKNVLSALASLGFLFSGAAFPLGALENPQQGAAVSGISAISGWHCSASQIEIRIDDKTTFVAGSRTSRADTQAVCGRSDTGYALLFNWNTLGPGTHTVLAIADGAQFAEATVMLNTLGAEFLKGRAGSVRLDNFPDFGKGLLLAWQEAQQNFAITQIFNSVPPLSDTWYGSNLENRTNCSSPQNNGQRGTYSTYSINTGNGAINIVQSGVTGLSCTYGGTLTEQNAQRSAAGSFSCSDGKQGTWASNDIEVSANSLLIRYASQLSGSETCSISGVFSGARL
jgi:hypothetical protein